MCYRILTDLVIVLHLLFIFFVVFGGLLVLWRMWVALPHLPAACWGAYIEFSGNLCPLTPLENHFRHLAGRKGYATDFVDHYLVPLVYPPGLTPEIQILLGLLVVAVNGVVYFFVLRRYFGQSSKKNVL